MNEGDASYGDTPVHLGLILDGNRRWARERGLPALEGHRRGYDRLHAVARAAADKGVRYISAYVFSTENWSRTQEEVDFLMDLLLWVVKHEVDKFVKEGLRIVFLGSKERLSAKVLQAILAAETKTRDGARAVVALCFNYGGEMELAEAAAGLVRDGVPAVEVTPRKLAEYLYHPEIPPVDLIIRTSGEQRLSGFMLWRASYAELYFTEVLWPAFGVADLDAALAEYGRRKRRFGK